MALDIRPIRDDEVEQAEAIVAYSFNSQDRYDLTAAIERSRKFFDLSWSLASFEDGEMTAFVRTIPFAFRINGRAFSFGAVGPVVSLPQHRRKGHVGALLRRALADMRERGQVLSGLHTPHPTLYQRYGWEIATAERLYTFNPKDIVLKTKTADRGRTRMVQADDWQALDRVYRAYGKRRNSLLHRGEVWWREGIFASSQPVKGDAALWEDTSGEAQGYVVYYQGNENTGAGEGVPRFRVRELVALTSDAYLNLVQHLLRHDIAPKIGWSAAPDDPFLSLVDDAAKVSTTQRYDLMLRVVDAEAALRLREPADHERTVALTVGLTDASAPWNEGSWRIEIEDGETSVEKVSDKPEISLSTTTLAPLFNGHLTPRSAALAGRLSARSEEVLDRAEALFATRFPPHCPDGF